MFAVPPPDEGGLRSIVEICSWVTDLICFPTAPASRTEFGLSTIACVTLGMSVGGVRKVVALIRSVSGNEMGLLGGFMVNGVMLTVGKFGLPTLVEELP